MKTYSELEKKVSRLPMEIPDENLILDSLHAKIMADISQKPIPVRRRIPPWQKAYGALKRQRVWIARTLFSGLLMASFVFYMNKPESDSIATQELLAISVENPAVTTQTLFLDQEEELVELAARPVLDNITYQEFDSIVGDL